MGFSRQEYWSGLSFLSPGYLLNPGIEPMSSALVGGFFTTESPGKPSKVYHWYIPKNKSNKRYAKPCRENYKISLCDEKWKWKSLSPTVCNPMDSSLPGSMVHGIFQARILEWAVISFSRGSFQPRDWTQVSCIADRRFTVWATREALIKDFGVVNKADVFLELSCSFNDHMDVGNLISDSSVFLNPAWTSGSSEFMYCWSLAWRILSN